MEEMTRAADQDTFALRGFPAFCDGRNPAGRDQGQPNGPAISSSQRHTGHARDVAPPELLLVDDRTPRAEARGYRTRLLRSQSPVARRNCLLRAHRGRQDEIGILLRYPSLTFRVVIPSRRKVGN